MIKVYNILTYGINRYVILKTHRSLTNGIHVVIVVKCNTRGAIHLSVRYVNIM